MTHKNLLSARGWGTGEDDGKESHRSVSIPTGGHWIWKLLAFSGPGYMVAVGYMDPGNWATDLVGGSAFSYTLLSVILLSSLSAILLQYLSAKLGIATGRDLAEITRASVPRPVAIFLWLMAEIMIIACDLAEVIGTAVALLLLFHIPIVWGVCITALDVLLLLYLQKKGLRLLEALVVCLITIIGVSLGIDVVMAHPSLVGIFSGLVPSPAIFTNTDMLYVAIGIIGATVMPHNLYLHSALSQTRAYEESEEGKRQAIKYSGIDSGIALSFAFLINAAILILSAAAFNAHGLTEVADIENAYTLLSPLLGVGFASILFAVALLAAGQNSTLTGTMAGQIIMEGFLNIRLAPWLRRIITRGLAIVPALLFVLYVGGDKVTQLLVFSQVVLSVQLPFAMIPLVYFTSSKKVMGQFKNSILVQILAIVIATVITGLNVWLVWSTFA
ncbi:MAG TPA: Nramp family divalent metal transporter [Candidatus Paceibacterota bacterium]|nr:Nramp family divalent metal transporter [Candidatus Paceibacterota bacterium]